MSHVSRLMTYKLETSAALRTRTPRSACCRTAATCGRPGYTSGPSILVSSRVGYPAQLSSIPILLWFLQQILAYLKRSIQSKRTILFEMQPSSPADNGSNLLFLLNILHIIFSSFIMQFGPKRLVYQVLLMGFSLQNVALPVLKNNSPSSFAPWES